MLLNGTVPSGWRSYVFYQPVCSPLTQEEEDRGAVLSAWKTLDPADKAKVPSAYKKEMTIRSVSEKAMFLLSIAALTTGGLYLGEIITTAEMVPLAATLCSLDLLFRSRRHDNKPFHIIELFKMMVIIAVAILISEKILDPMILTPLILGVPLHSAIHYFLPKSSSIKGNNEVPPSQKKRSETLLMINMIIGAIFSTALPSLLLFTNYLSIESAASIFLGGCTLIAILNYSSLSPHSFKLSLLGYTIAVAVAALVFFHLLSEHYLIGHSIFSAPPALIMSAFMIYHKLKSPTPAPAVKAG